MYTLVAALVGLVFGAVGFVAFVHVASDVRVVRVAVLALVFLSPLTGGLSRGFVVPVFRPQELLLLSAFALVTAHVFLSGRRPASTVVDWAFLLLMITGAALPVVVALLIGSPLSRDGLMTLIGPIKFYMVYRVGLEFSALEGDLRQLLQALLVSGALVGCVAVLEYYNVGGVRSVVEGYFTDMTFSGPDSPWGQRFESTRRVVATLGAWNVLGSFLAFNIVLLAGSVLGRHDVLGRGPVVAVVLATLAGLLLTGSMASTLGMILALVVLAALQRRFMPLVAGGALVALVSVPLLPFLVNRIRMQYPMGHQGILPRSVQYRIMLWTDQFLPALEGNALFGLGGDLPISVDWMTEESYYLFTLFKGGVVYLAGALILFGVVIGVLWARRRETSGLQRLCAEVGLALSFALLVINLNNAYSTYGIPAQSYWLLVGLALAPTTRPRRDGDPIGASRPRRSDPVPELAPQHTAQRDDGGGAGVPGGVRVLAVGPAPSTPAAARPVRPTGFGDLASAGGA